jgi:glycosyltransferase involved in cell wall biosynthesis
MRLAVVVPRYGPDVAGGAESQARGFATEAVRRGWQVEVWTTCARNHYTWENAYPAGLEEIEGVPVRRFPVVLRCVDRWRTIEGLAASGGGLSVADQYDWLDCGAHSPDLYHHVARHADRFDAIVALPYAMQLIHCAAWAALGRTVFWPCLHNEPYAFLQVTHLLLESVWGVMFNSPEDRDLANHILGVRPRCQAVLGEGVTLAPVSATASQPVLSDLLYVGRLEGGKNLSLLYKYVRQYASEGGNLRLVVVGRGPFEPPRHPAFEYLGFVSEEEKARCYATALALCQPSLNESFSLTMMESWLAGRPALVHEQCQVTRAHVRRSQGGLCFDNYEAFVAAVEWLQSNPALAARMGSNGREYVQRNYTWPAIADRFERLVTMWKDK